MGLSLPEQRPCARWVPTAGDPRQQLLKLEHGESRVHALQRGHLYAAAFSAQSRTSVDPGAHARAATAAARAAPEAGDPDFRSAGELSGSGFLRGRRRPGSECGRLRPGSGAMEKLRRVLSGQDDEEQGLTAQVGSPRRPGAAERGAGPVCCTCSRREAGAPGRSGVRRGSLGARPRALGLSDAAEPAGGPFPPGLAARPLPEPGPAAASPPRALENASCKGGGVFGKKGTWSANHRSSRSEAALS